jgi:penicillin-binding protein 2
MQLRIRVIGLILGLAFLVLAGRLWYLQIAQGSEYRIKSENNRLRTIRALAPRGQILDRKGRLLATTRPQISVAVTTSELKDPETVLQRLAEILGTTQMR